MLTPPAALPHRNPAALPLFAPPLAVRPPRYATPSLLARCPAHRPVSASRGNVVFASVAQPTHGPNASPPSQQGPAHRDDRPADASDNASDKHRMSEETRRKISYTMLGRPKSLEMRAKVSAAMKGRTPWNKGKKLSPETRARMSQAHTGLTAWNKGRSLSKAHRDAISAAASNPPRSLSAQTRRRMRMARRRPGDALVSGTAGPQLDHGTYSLVDSAEINDYVSLRRELRLWSDRFCSRNGRRPTLADVRRVAPVPVMRKFEAYVAMRDRIRGLANDVYGNVNLDIIPSVPVGNMSTTTATDSKTDVVVTKHGNKRMVDSSESRDGDPTWYDASNGTVVGASDDMWDEYDRPAASWGPVDSHTAEYSLIGVHELTPKSEHLSPSDYRKIGRHRLIETMDINQYVRLRRELKDWSESFKKEHGRTPSVSDAKKSGRPILYKNICQFLELREKMTGLMKEVYGTEVDDVEALSKVSAEGKQALQALRERAEERRAMLDSDQT